MTPQERTELESIHQALSTIYPGIAGHAIVMQEHALYGAAEWGQMAKTLHDALTRVGRLARGHNEEGQAHG